MPSYVITGVSKGLGFELLRILSSNPKNTVIGLVRDKAGTEKKVSEDLNGRSNIHILHGDLIDHESLAKAATETASITGGGLDYLIANGAYISRWDAFDPIDVLAEQPERIAEELSKLNETNIGGNIQLFRRFLPLILKGDVKKVVSISSGLSDLRTMNDLGIPNSPLYALNKASLNLLVGRFATQYKDQGVLFCSICPGMVELGHFVHLPPKQLGVVKAMEAKFKENVLGFTGPTPPDVAMQNVINTWEKASIENGDSGVFFSSFGTKYGY